MIQSDGLLLEIARCSDLARVRADRSHPCACIVRVQDKGADHNQAPEPWSGHIETAPILFIGSNPSIGERDRFPTASWNGSDVVGYFQRRFDQVGGCVSSGEFNKVRYWTAVRARAKEIIKRDPIPGKDFALTEVVHCKSKGETGVEDALLFCTARWLGRVMSQSGASIIVLLGRHARKCAESWGRDPHRPVHFGVPIAGHSRAVVILPHPNAHTRRKLGDHVSPEALGRLQALV